MASRSNIQTGGDLIYLRRPRWWRRSGHGPPGGGDGGSGGALFTRIDFTTGSLGAASLSRSSTATYINNSGVLSTAGVNVARFNYDANYPRGNAAPSLTGPFLLVEPAATNLAFQSNNYAATWFVTNGSVATSAQFTSPDGTNNGWNVTSGTGFGAQGQALTVAAVPYTPSIWAYQRTGTPPLQLSVNGASTGNITTSATITRYAAPITPSAGAGNNFVLVNSASGQALGTFGYQFETGSVATSYIPTTTSSASRSADVVTFTQPVGCGHNTYTFDDNSTQTVAQSPGLATVPTNLNRPNIKYIDGSP
jgi:hypothetical protein